MNTGMSEFCAELTKWRKNCKILQIILSNTALSSALTAATASAKHKTPLNLFYCNTLDA